MKVKFNELFDSFKDLNELEKKKAIIDFLKKDIQSLQTINRMVENSLENKDIDKIILETDNIDDALDIIYQLIHLLTEQIETFAEKVATDFYE